MEVFFFAHHCRRGISFTRACSFFKKSPKFWGYMAFYFIFRLDGGCLGYSVDMGFKF